MASSVCTLPSIQIAHVVVVSDNRENAKRLAKGVHGTPFLHTCVDMDEQLYLPSLLIQLL